MKPWIALSVLFFAATGCAQGLTPESSAPEASPTSEYRDGKADRLSDGAGALCTSDMGQHLYRAYLPLVFGSGGWNDPNVPREPTTYPNPSRSTWHTTKRVKMVIYDPVLSSGEPMIDHYGWHDPDELAQQYAEAMNEATGRAVKFEIVEREVRDRFPPMLNRPQFDAASYEALYDGCKSDPALCPTNSCETYDPETCPNPEPRADYEAMLTGVCSEVESCEVDEVWLFGGPFLGFYESRMVGDGSLSINSGPLHDGCDRRYIVMGFSPERDVGSMLHNVGHMIESYFQIAFRAWEPVTGPLGDDPYAFFRRWREGYDADNPGGPSVCGDTHRTPNSSDAAYFYWDESPVESVCDGFYEYPHVDVEARTINCEEWGCDEVGYQKWVFDHVPRSQGQFNGYPNNWWKFVFGYNYYLPRSCDELNLANCALAPSCDWYACGGGESLCGAVGYSDALMCDNECVDEETLDSCDAAGCAWYACSEGCFPPGTPLDEACP